MNKHQNKKVYIKMFFLYDVDSDYTIHTFPKTYKLDFLYIIL